MLDKPGIIKNFTETTGHSTLDGGICPPSVEAAAKINESETSRKIEMLAAKCRLDTTSLTSRALDGIAQYVNAHDPEGIDRRILESVIGQWPNEKARTQLAVAYFENLDDINFINDLFSLAYGHDVDEKALYGLLNKYNAITEQAVSLESFVQENLKNPTEFSSDDFSKLRETLGAKAKKIVHDAALATQRGASGDTSQVIVEKLNKIKEENAAYVSFFKQLKLNAEAQGKRLDFKQLAGTWYYNTQCEQLRFDGKYVVQMDQIYEQNYPIGPYNEGKYPKEFVDSLRYDLFPKDYPTLYNELYDRFYILEKDEKILSYVRFLNNFNAEKVKVESIHFGAFNTNPDFAGGLIGNEMLRHALEEESKRGADILAECDPRTKASQDYIEMGFIATGEFEYKGVPSLNLKMASGTLIDTPEKIKQREMAKVDIVAKSISSPEGEGYVIKTSPEKQVPDFFPLQNGFVLTRYFTQGDKRYCLFEKLLPKTEDPT